jgi:type II secretory pathway pseudopilin PulG
MVELLVVIVIIGILAAMLTGALHATRETAKEMATKATIAKLNAIIMQRYESYLTRRVPVTITPCPYVISAGMTQAQKDAIMAQQQQWFRENTRKRLDAIRDIVRMEMPDAKTDVTNDPIMFTCNGESWSVPEPTLHRLYAANPPIGDHDGAQCLFLIVSMGSPEAMEQFHQSELGTVDGKPCFVDGWGTPIAFLRWAPGFRSPLQNGDSVSDHDPFDSRNADQQAFHMIPLIYSAGPDKVYDIDTQAGYVFAGDPYAEPRLGQPMSGGHYHDNITNHLIEMR